MQRLASPQQRGVTLLEVLISSSILAMVMVVALSLLGETADISSLEVNEVSMERDVQWCLDDIVVDLKEASPDKVSFLDFQLNDSDQTWQTALCFPTARTQGAGEFIYTDALGEVQPQPAWQGVVVYAICYDTAMGEAWLARYTDWAPYRDYDLDMPTVMAVTAEEIILSDGTTFDRHASSGMNGNQEVRRMPGGVIQLVRNPLPPRPALYPLALRVVARRALRELKGDNLEVTSATSVLARNNN